MAEVALPVCVESAYLSTLPSSPLCPPPVSSPGRCVCPGAVWPQTGCLNNRHGFSQSSGGWVSEIKVWTGLASSQDQFVPDLSPSCYWTKVTLLTAQQPDKSKRWDIEARNMTLFRKSADWEGGRLMPQNNHLIGVWMPGSFTEQR